MNADAKPTTTARSTHYIRRVLVPTIMLLALSTFVMLYGQRVLDHIDAMQYTPTSAVATVNTKLDLTWLGHDLFYASKPSIETGTAFNDNCKSTERSAAILGCYYQRSIYLYDVTNPELDGAEEVTAAHEMLHAAYDRLQPWEKSHVDAMLQSEYDKIKGDTDLQQLVSYYRANEPGELNNELHSIIGTTIANLSPDLESYYSQYFQNRQAIVAMNTSYNAVFKNVQEQSKVLIDQINSIGPKLQTDLTNYEAASSILSSDITVFNQRASSGYYQTQSEFNAARDALVARSNQLDAERVSLNQRIDAYNALIKQYNDLSVRASQLNSSINGVPSQAPSV